MIKKDLQQKIREHFPFTGMLYELMKNLLDSERIKYHIVESRTKELESLEEKITRKKLIKDLNTEILDITGIRVILYYQDDLDLVENLINNNFIVDNDNSVNKANLFESNEFGYVSRHYIVKLSRERARLTEWKRFSKLFAEIQVRTVLQHSWASISHELSYKKKYDIPRELSRKLFRLAGLFELADEQFLDIRDEHQKLKSAIEQLNIDELDEEQINKLTLKRNLALTDNIFEKISELAIDSGFAFPDEEMRMSIDEYQIDQGISGIKLSCDILRIDTIGQLNQKLSELLPEMQLFYEKLILKSGKKWYGDKAWFILLATLYGMDKAQLKDFSKQYSWNSDIWDRTYETILELKQ